MTPIRRSFESQGLALNYVDWGNAGAPPLILIHGGRDHARSWDGVAQALCAERHVVAVDVRGHGDSAWSPDGAYAAPYLVGDLAALVETLGGGPVAVAAHSMGAVIALRHAALFPGHVTRIAAIEGIGLAPPEETATIETWRQFVARRLDPAARTRRVYATLDEAIARLRAEVPRLDAGLARHLALHGTSAAAGGGLVWKHDPLLRVHYPGDLSNAEQRAMWRAVACPVWLVHGAESWARHPQADGRAAEFGDVRVTSFAEAGHWVHHDRADAFVAGLRDFLAG